MYKDSFYSFEKFAFRAPNLIGRTSVPSVLEDSALFYAT